MYFRYNIHRLFKMLQNIQNTIFKCILNILYYIQVYNILPTSGYSSKLTLAEYEEVNVVAMH